jgi:YD repeat-containing protein
VGEAHHRLLHAGWSILETVCRDNRVSTYARDGAGYVLRETLPDGSSRLSYSPKFWQRGGEK